MPTPTSSHANPTQLTGVLDRILFQNSENHYCVAEFDTGKEGSFTIVGNLPGVQCGETLELQGEWVDHPNHGRQFKVTRFHATLPATVHGLRKYLGSGLVPGIGKTYAQKIVDFFGLDTLDVISHQSARLQEVPGIGAKRAREIKSAWDRQQSERDVLVFLQTYGVTTAQCIRIVNRFGAAARNIISEDPYRIAREIKGIGFRTADRIALNLGFASDSRRRLEAGLRFSLEDLESEGHTAAPAKRLLEHAAHLLEIEPSLLDPLLEGLVKRRELLPLPSEPSLLQTPAQAYAENIIERNLRLILACPPNRPTIKTDAALAWAEKRAGFSFAPEQSKAVRTVINGKCVILTGGPGTGKTTILRAIVDIFRAKKLKVALAAPTGRAAQRLTEATRSHAQTLHRLLRFDPSEGRFLANDESPLKADLVIVDESSMLDNRLAAALIRAIPATASLLLVGDADQLPSVGAGNVLHDIAGSGQIPVVSLKTIFRQKQRSRIVTTAHAILQGDARPPATVSSPAELDPNTDLQLIHAPDPDQCLQSVTTLCHSVLPANLGCDPFKDIQVLAPIYKGRGGISVLNTRLQQTLNPDRNAITFGQLTFRLGDKVIQNRNNYDKGIFNGDIGRVTAVLPEAGTLAADFGNGPVDLDRADLPDLNLAYAISIHKSQGSEFPIVIIPLLKQHFILLQRNLLYTAITRGRRRVFIVGDPAAWAMAVNNTETAARITGLPFRLAPDRDSP